MECAVTLVFPHHGTNPERIDSGPSLKADDEQAVRYVAGYVAMALKKSMQSCQMMQQLCNT